MPIDFFRENCRTRSSLFRFGLCDDPPPSVTSAYIDEANEAKWIATVENSEGKEVSFFAIDQCVTILKSDGNPEKRCDGLLFQDKKIIFVELKERGTGRWLGKGREQLTATIQKFKLVNDINFFILVEAYVCNKLKPSFHNAHAVNIQKFKDDTGLILKTSNTIKI